jgi:hypothetical protein
MRKYTVIRFLASIILSCFIPLKTLSAYSYNSLEKAQFATISAHFLLTLAANHYEQSQTKKATVVRLLKELVGVVNQNIMLLNQYELDSPIGNNPPCSLFVPLVYGIIHLGSECKAVIDCSGKKVENEKIDANEDSFLTKNFLPTLQAICYTLATLMNEKNDPTKRLRLSFAVAGTLTQSNSELLASSIRVDQNYPSKKKI